MAEGAVVGGLGPGLVLVSLAVVVRGALARELTSPGGLQQRHVDIVDSVDIVDIADISDIVDTADSVDIVDTVDILDIVIL